MARLAYILSASHSGSTLLAMLLGAHPEAATVGELKATSMGDPDRYRCSCGALIRQCGYWTRIREAMKERGIHDFDICRAQTSIDEAPSRYARRLLSPLCRGRVLESIRDSALWLSPRWRAHLAATQCRTAALVEVVLTVNGARIVVDSSKLALRLKYLLRNPVLEILVIRLIRDGRAVSLTYTDEWTFADACEPSLRGGGSGAPREMGRRDLADAAREWRRSNQAADCLVARLPRRQWTEVRYEQLCLEPAAVLRRLCEFLGLDLGRMTLDFRARVQHVIGNGMRLDKTSDIRIDDRWRSHLTPADLGIFQTVAGDLNRKYGYS